MGKKVAKVTPSPPKKSHPQNLRWLSQKRPQRALEPGIEVAIGQRHYKSHEQ